MPELSAPHDRTRVRVIVRGEVQGVGYRWYTREQALGLGVSGWVRNLADGRVEAVFEGEPGAVDRLVLWCRSGPRTARVEDVDVREETATGEEGFRIVR